MVGGAFFLATPPASSFMTEQTIYVDGGFMCERSRSITKQ